MRKPLTQDSSEKRNGPVRSHLNLRFHRLFLFQNQIGALRRRFGPLPTPFEQKQTKETNSLIAAWFKRQHAGNENVGKDGLRVSPGGGNHWERPKCCPTSEFSAACFLGFLMKFLINGGSRTNTGGKHEMLQGRLLISPP
jgi:hypothetical protein